MERPSNVPETRLRSFKVGDTVILRGALSDSMENARQIKVKGGFKPLTVMEINSEGYYLLYRDPKHHAEGAMCDHYTSGDHLAKEAK